MDMVQRMIDARMDHDETQQQLAKAINFNRVQLAKYENRTNIPPIAYLKAICEHYHISADYILGLPRGLDWPR